MGWLQVVVIFALLVALVIASLVLLAGRRRWLDRLGGTFECSLRLDARTPGVGWAVGVGRYTEGVLEWYRFFSYAPRPRMRFPRTHVRVLQTREPDQLEAISLSSEQRVVRVQVTNVDQVEWELAMSPDSLTGLLSWLEAAPPGVRRIA